jgi:hypothetical protein
MIPLVHYHVYMTPPPVPILRQINLVQAPIAIFEDSFEYYPPIYAWVFPVVSFPHVSAPKPLRVLQPGKLETLEFGLQF